jgi:DNA-binding CsgD family transcriptional regulator
VIAQASGLWPLCGRDADLAAVSAWFALDEVGGVVLGGDAGVGKSALAATLADTLPADRVVRVAANPALAPVPYGAMAHLVPADGIDANGQVDRAAVLRSLASGSARTVVVVDDPGELDEGSMGLLAQLVGTASAFLIATVRTGTEVPPALVSLERTAGIRRLVLEPLSASTITDLVPRALGAPVAGGAIDVLVRASAGNPMYLRELVEHATASGILVLDGSGEWQLTGELGPSRRLVDVVADRLGRLPDTIRETAKLLALGAPLRWTSLERGGHADAAVELERAGVVMVHDQGDPTIELAHPLHGEVLRADIRVLERRRLLGVLIDWLDVEDAPIEERLRVADWQLDIGRSPDVGTLEEGARRAWSARDHGALERFARAALDQRPTLAMAALLTEALIHTGRADEADGVVQEALAGDDGSAPRDRSRLVGLRVFNDLWYRERPDDAGAVVAAERRTALDPIADDELLIQEAYVALARSDAQAVLDLLEHRAWTDEVAPQGLLLAAQMMADTGRVLDGLATLGAAAVASTSDRALTVSTAGSIDAATVRLTILAGDLDGAEGLIERFGGRPDYRADPFIRGYLLLSAGRIALHRGRPVTARRLLAEGRGIGEQQRNRVTTMGCTAGLAVAAAYLRDEAACRRWYDELVGFDMARVVRPSIASGMAWALSTLGEPARARDLLVAEIDHARSRREVVDAAMLTADLVRLGDPGEARALLTTFAPEVDGLAGLLCRAGLALAGSSPADLEAVERDAAAAGVSLVAAELAVAGARAARRQGDGRGATAAQLRADDHLSGCEGGSTPGTVAADAVSPLSHREREIATLAAGGLSNQEIADRLFVSVRTVGNHLQNAYTKLGISGRTGLAAALHR